MGQLLSHTEVPNPMCAPQHNNKAARFVSTVLLSGILLAFAAPGVGATQPQSEQPPATAHPAPTLSRQIRRALAQLPFYSVFDILHYTVSGGQVTLTGAVIHPTLKSDAEATVKKIEGV